MASATLPLTWSLTSYFPACDSSEYRTYKATYRSDLQKTLERTARLGQNDSPAETLVSDWARSFCAWEDLTSRSSHLSSYIGCLSAADATSELYQAEDAALSQLEADLTKIKTHLILALRSLDAAHWEQLLSEPQLQGAAHTLRRFQAEAKFQMSADQEALAADLGVDGFKAWGQLYDTVSGKLSFSLTFPDGRHEQIPMAQRNGLLGDADRAIRHAAFVEGNRAWAGVGDTCAAVLNALAGTRHTLYARRGHSDFLAAPLHDQALSRQTLDALFHALSRNYDLPRRLLALGARLQKTPGLAWYDLNAPRPLQATAQTFTFNEGVQACQDAFDSAYPKLGDYFRKLVARQWIEAEKRPGKRAGAFQSSSPILREERIYMTFSGKVNDVVTLAHEAGHAWHTHLLGDLRPCSRDYPMTLAETASTFAENILVQGLLSEPGLTPQRRAFLLDMKTNHMPAYLLNIPARFLFESKFYEERRHGIVSPRRLCELMVDTQRDVYGDVLTPGEEDPWFWASKLHFFLPSVAFYNFPYTFGFLLSQALFAQFQSDGPAFLHHYEAFLKESGRATCEQAVRSTLGWEIDQPDFWERAIQSCAGSIQEFADAAASSVA